MKNKKLASLLLLLPITAFAQTPVTVDVHAGISFDDNVTRAAHKRDIKSDTIIDLGAAAGYVHTLTTSSNLVFNADLTLQQYQDYDKLSNTELGLEATYQIQFENNFDSPWYFVSARYANVNYDSTLRDGDYTEMGIGLGKRLTDKVKLLAGFKHYNSTAENSLFDLSSNVVYINFDYLLDNKNTLYLVLNLSDGGIISTNTPPHPSQLGSVPWVDDDAYPDLSSPWTYQLDATTSSFRIGDSITLAYKQSLDISAMYYNSDADYSFNYSGLIIDLTYFYRF